MGFLAVLGEVDVTTDDSWGAGAEDFVVAVVGAQALQHPFPASFLDAFSAGEEKLTDLVERVGPPPPVGRGLCSGPGTGLRRCTGWRLRQVKRVDHPGGVIDMCFRARVRSAGAQEQLPYWQL